MRRGPFARWTPEEEALLTASGAAHCAGAPARGLRDCECGGAGDSLAGRLFALCAAAASCCLPDERVRALVMTSANLSEEPIAIDNDEARARLGGIADAFLMHDREILQRCDDSVMAIVDGAPQLIRRARGFVPLGIELPPLARAGCAATAGRGRAPEERLCAGAGPVRRTRASIWAISKT